MQRKSTPNLSLWKKKVKVIGLIGVTGVHEPISVVTGHQAGTKDHCSLTLTIKATLESPACVFYLWEDSENTCNTPHTH